MQRIIPLVCVLILTACTGPTEPPPAQESAAQPVRLDTPTGTIHGTLLLPAGPGPYPVALLIAGSGPTDRNGNSILLPGASNSL